MGKNLRRLLAACLLVLLSLPAPLAAAESPGRDRSAHALTGGRVIAAPGRVFDPGVVVVRGGVIEAVGPVGSTRVPADASAVDTTGRVVYAAFLDPYVTVDRLAGRSPKKPRDEEEAEGDAPRER